MRPAARFRVGVLAVVALAGCGPPSGASNRTELTVLAAASLKTVLPEIGAGFTGQNPDVAFTFAFAGTDQLAAQIREGAPADVFAGASTAYGDLLLQAGLIEPYLRFCTNRLVMVVPSSNPAGIASLEDLASRPAILVIGSETVPVGSYTRTALANLDALYGSGYSGAVLGKAVSNEDSVASILTKVASGEADAGFVYATDARSAGSMVRSFGLPPQARAVATYPVAVVEGSPHGAVARRFAGFLLEPTAQRLLRQAAFGPPPAP
jgi:molybdate transport system substrate-binding protein